MGRVMRAGVRVGLFVCLRFYRERPPCEGFIPSVTAEGSEVEIRGFPSVPRAPRGGMHGQRSVPPRACKFAQKKLKPEEKRFVTPL